MTVADRWISAIEEACHEPDPAQSNRRITRLHYLLSEALAEKLGRDSGPNFHSWAVWGSRKAGVTIRQEDLDSAIGNALATAGIVGSLVGAGVGVFLQSCFLHSLSIYAAAAFGVVIGALTGSWTGKQLAVWSRAKAAKLILEGNRIVIRDIGQQSAHFLELLENGARLDTRETFFAGLRPGPTETHGQDRLAAAFSLYFAAFDSDDPKVRRARMIAGNCEIVYHEHIRLEPYIRQAMPFIIRRCATQRLMTYEVGNTVFTVGKDLPGIPTRTAATNWTKIEERMRYIFALFRKFHNEREVFANPFSEKEMAQLGHAGDL